MGLRTLVLFATIIACTFAQDPATDTTTTKKNPFGLDDATASMISSAGRTLGILNMSLSKALVQDPTNTYV